MSTAPLFDDPRASCPACASTRVAPWREKRRYGVAFAIWRCRDCDSGFLNPRPAPTWLRDIYGKSGHGLTAPISYERALQDEREYPNSTVDAARLVGRALALASPAPHPLRLLDVGSGFGFFSAAALSRGLEVTAVNPGTWENDVFERMNGFRPVESFVEDAALPGPYDIVVMSQVLEHLPDPYAVLQKVVSLLRPGGVVAAAVPNVGSFLVRVLGTRENGCLWVPEHLNHFSRAGLTRLLERAGCSPAGYAPVSRIPYHALSRRLGLRGRTRALGNAFVRAVQALPCRGANALGWSLYHNVWAVRA